MKQRTQKARRDPVPKAVEPLDYLDYKRAAKYVGLAEVTLRKYVKDKKGPVPIRIGRRVMFDRADLIGWMDKHKVYPRVED